MSRNLEVLRIKRIDHIYIFRRVREREEIEQKKKSMFIDSLVSLIHIYNNKKPFRLKENLVLYIFEFSYLFCFEDHSTNSHEILIFLCLNMKD